MSTEKTNIDAHLKKLKHDYAQQLPEKIMDLSKRWAEVKETESHEKMVILHRDVHSLIGTSGTFGFMELSQKAREVEILLKTASTEQHIDPALSEVLDQLFNELNRCANTPVENAHLIAIIDQKDGRKTAKLNTELKQPKVTPQPVVPLIYYLDDDVAASIVLVENLNAYGFKAIHFKQCDELLAHIQKEVPSLVIFDLIMPDLTERQIFEVIQQLNRKRIKVFVLSSKQDFNSRLAAVRSGADAYIVKPADVPSLINSIRNELQLNLQKTANVLIIDDQESILDYYSSLLLAAGVSVASTSNPLEILDKLEQNRPDLILLDINMPLVNGYETAAVIRQFEEYQSIPILFLSAETSAEKKSSLLEIGSDDLLSKDIPPLEFVRQIRSRVERAKILSSFMYEDSLTGLLNHAQIQLAAERTLSTSLRYKRNCSIGMIDIDNFKHINDTYGHQTGDKVIKALSQLLQQRLRATDYIGRYGGEEFMLVMPETAIESAGSIVNELRKAFSAIEFIEQKGKFTISFSAGIAESKEKESLTILVRRADDALYRAKANGKNKVCIHYQ